MLLTEEEAKTKWCPHVRHSGEVGGTFNRGTQHGPLNDHEHNAGTLCNCIASACMAWRLGYVEEVRPDHPMALPASDPRTKLDRYLIGETRRFLPRKGFCGIAGKPEA